MSKLGRIVLDSNYKNPRLIIAEENDNLRAIELVKDSNSDKRSFKISKDAITKLSYRGKKLDDCSANLTSSISVSNLKLREIGVLSEECYFTVLQKFVNHHVYMGANDPTYLSVREEVHNQLIKRMNTK